MAEKILTVQSLTGGVSRYASERIVQHANDQLSYELGGAQGQVIDKILPDLAATGGEIQGDANLSEQGKRAAIQKAAREAIAKLDHVTAASPAKWRSELDRLVKEAVAKLPKAPADAVLASDTRRYIHDLPTEQRHRFLRDNLTDPLVAGVVVTTPSYLLGIGEATLSGLRERLVEIAAPALVGRIEAIRIVLGLFDATERAVRRVICEAGGLPRPAAAESGAA
jgi:hypothetical protein